MSYFNIAVIFVAIFAISDVIAVEKLPQKYQDFKVESVKLMEQCGAKYNINKQKIEEAIENEKIQDLDPCFLGCLFDNTGLINNKGQVIPGAAKARFEKYMSKPEHNEKVTKLLERCSNEVNANSKDTCESGRLFAPCLLDVYDIISSSN